MIATAAQTIGPFFREGLTRPAWSDLTRDGAAGEAIRIDGVVLDADGDAVPDAMIEIWHADPHGRAGERPDYGGFGRACTDADGRFTFRTVVPGAIAPGEAPYIAVSVFARGLLKRLITRLYFADRAEENAVDPVLASVPQARRATLLAQRSGDAATGIIYRFDIRLQGADETVFFEL